MGQGWVTILQGLLPSSFCLKRLIMLVQEMVFFRDKIVKATLTSNLPKFMSVDLFLFQKFTAVCECWTSLFSTHELSQLEGEKTFLFSLQASQTWRRCPSS